MVVHGICAKSAGIAGLQLCNLCPWMQWASVEGGPWAGHSELSENARGWSGNLFASGAREKKIKLFPWKSISKLIVLPAKCFILTIKLFWAAIWEKASAWGTLLSDVWRTCLPRLAQLLGCHSKSRYIFVTGDLPMSVWLPLRQRVLAIGLIRWGTAVGVAASCNETNLLDSRPHSHEYLRHQYQYTAKAQMPLRCSVQERTLSHSWMGEMIATKWYRAWHPDLVRCGDVSDQPLYWLGCRKRQSAGTALAAKANLLIKEEELSLGGLFTALPLPKFCKDLS